MLVCEASKLTEAKLEWVWAYRVQLNLLDAFDAEGIQCAKTQWNADSWSRFLSTYRLTRGAHSGLRKRHALIEKHVAGAFQNAVTGADAAEALTDRWREAVTLIAKLLKRWDGSSAELWSMTSKLLWFYQPRHMTMFDRFAFSAIRALPGAGLEKLKREDFLLGFEKVFVEKKADIDEAARFSDRVYPYPRRVLDKWLWLRGSGNRGHYLEKFRLSLQAAPLPAR